MLGAPFMTWFGGFARRNALILLMAIFTVGNLIAAFSPSYMSLLGARLITSLNHGAFFGIGSVVASIVPAHKQASAVATMFMGLTIANIGGVSNMGWAKHWLAYVFPCDFFVWRNYHARFMESAPSRHGCPKTKCES